MYHNDGNVTDKQTKVAANAGTTDNETTYRKPRDMQHTQRATALVTSTLYDEHGKLHSGNDLIDGDTFSPMTVTGVVTDNVTKVEVPTGYHQRSMTW